MTAITVPFPTSPRGTESTALEILPAVRSRPDDCSGGNWVLVLEGVGLVTIPLMNDRGET